MKTYIIPSKNRHEGYSLLMVVTLSGISMLVLAAALTWTMTNTTLNERSNQYYNTVAAAEAASEKVLAAMAQDYQDQGESRVWANRSTYSSRVPNSSECALWGDFEFTDAQGNAGTYVARLASASFVPLDSQYQGLYGLASTYRVVSNARMPNGQYDIKVGLKQDLQLASIPVFQFAIFYSVDLEINPGPDMTVTGRVHGNQNLYMQPQAKLKFLSDVTAAGSAVKDKSPLDPTIRNTNSSQWLFAPGKDPDSGKSALTLPIGTNNSPDSVHAILEVPPDGESATSAMGKQRYFNKADVIILVSNNSVTVKSGLVDGFGTTIPTNEYKSFLITSNSFVDYRENKTIKTTEIDVAKFKDWSLTNNTVKPLLGGLEANSIYVADLRTNASASIQYGVKVKNGKILPSLGLTVATPNPLYVQGNFNAPDAVLNTNSTVGTKPASLVGDSINVLSTAWSDANTTYASRTASPTTVNAAFLGGIVPSNGTTYSGGVENFPRFHENWSSKTFTYNGSMVVMFFSKTAKRPWGSSGVYSPPIRQWAFDINFLDAAKLPPGTPAVRALIRGEWTTVKSGYVTGI